MLGWIDLSPWITEMLNLYFAHSGRHVAGLHEKHQGFSKSLTHVT